MIILTRTVNVKLLMDVDLGQKIEGMYAGDLVSSDEKKTKECTVQVKRLSKKLIKLDFLMKGDMYSFRGMLSEHEEGTLMIAQEKISDDYILSGVSGFLYKKPNVHGGFVKQLNSFYFHVILDHFNGDHQEVYFLGQKPGHPKPKGKLRKDKILQSSLSSLK